MKKVAIVTKPTAKPSADEWVRSREQEKEPIKRLTIDLPASLHRKVKMQCAAEGTTIAEEVRGFLMEKYGKA